ncbi:MAG: MOSC domain-containing protein [Desulfobacterota bacterium]|nr:MOSC domain-containing protein [Thermodesulfobacteriota bacterium]MDW8002507.1 MOSC domain-containing protein [Deltaproteobacteria bacterium]
MNKGRVISVNTSEKKGEKKRNVNNAFLVKDKGLQGDGHFGFMHRQVSLLSIESIEKMRNLGLDVGPGDFAENITTEGLDLSSLTLGKKLKVGERVILRVTQIGKECHERCAIYYMAGDCIMPKEGIFAEVIEGGVVKVGDPIEVIE